MSFAVSRLSVATTILALALPSVADARTTSSTVPTFPVPASARVHPNATATTPTATAATPTTTAPGAVAPGAARTPGGSAIKPLNSTAANARARTRAHSSRSGNISTEAIVLVAIAALILLACVAWAFARSRAYEPRWLLSLRHAMAEAGFRSSAAWAEFQDWVRLGH